MSAITAFLEDAPVEARHVLAWYNDPSGQEPGGFTKHIISAAHLADVENQKRLAKAFPLLVALVRIGKAGGALCLRDVAKAEPAALERVARAVELVETEAAAA